MKLKIRKELCEMEKNSYASDQIVLPEGGIDCSEGCNPCLLYTSDAADE